MTTDNTHADDLGRLLELDAEVLHAYLSELTGWLSELSDREPGHIMDLGSGTGTGAFALARRFPGARVTGMDLSPHMLHRMNERAGALGLDDRVHGLEANLDETWPRLETTDLIWTAAALHHLRDPDRALGQAFEALRPGGLLAATEMDFFPRFLPEDIGMGRPGLESRLHAALNTRPAVDWGTQFTRAGFALEATRPFAIDLSAPLPPATHHYAEASLRRLRAHLDNQLSAQDTSTLDALLDSDNPLGVARRNDVTVRTTRTTWVARRP